jgi:hypothetical protein
MASRPLQLAASLGQKLRQGKLPNGFRVGDVYLQGWPGLDTAERARVALGVLVDAGWVRARLWTARSEAEPKGLSSCRFLRDWPECRG